MKNKKFFSVLACLTVFGACAIGGACAGDNLIEGELGDYQWVYEQEFIDECDEYMTIDGKNEEDIWQDKTYFTHTEYRENKQVDLRMTTAFTQKGLYVYGEANDSTIEYTGRFTMTKNSGFTVLVAAEDVNRRWPMECLRLDLDAYNCRSWGQSRVAGKTTVEGEIGSGETQKMTMEMFISWKALLNESDDAIKDCFDENGDMKPDCLPTQIKLYPKYRQIIKKGETQTIYKIYPTFTDKEWVALYPYFDGNGYTQGEREDSVLGNAKNGLSKTCGWDLKNATETESEKSIRVSGRDNQAIYFKDVFAENFVVEATATPGECLSTLAGAVQNGQFGLIVQKSFTEFRALHLKTLNGGTGFSSANGEIILSGMTFYPNRVYTPTWGVAQSTKKDLGMDTAATSICMKLVKIGGNLAFFLNEKLVYQEYQSYVEGACAPGLYAYYNQVVFSDYSAKAIAENDVDEYLAKMGLSRIQITNKDGAPLTAGGSVTANKYFYATNEQIELSFNPSKGYVVSDFTVDGTDCYEQLCASIDGGRYVLDRTGDADGKISVTADYEYVVKKAVRKQVSGVVSLNVPQRFGGKKALSNVAVHVSAVGNPQFYFDTVTDENGTFKIDLCVAGTALPKDKEIATDGDTYILTFSHNGKEYTKNLLVNESYDENVTQDFLLGNESELPSIVSTASGLTIAENVWTYESTATDDGKPHFTWLATPDEGKAFNTKDYDGFTFALDTQTVSTDSVLRFDFELRSATGEAYRPRAAYAIEENGAKVNACSLTLYANDSTTGYIRLPSGFKGDILVLFEDFTRMGATLVSENGREMKARVWVLADNTGLSGVNFTMGDFKFIDYAKTVVESYGRSLVAPTASTAHVKIDNGTYTFSSSFTGVEWLLAGEKVTIDHKAYDALTFDMDTTATGGKEIKFALMFKNGNQADNTRAAFVYAIPEDGSAVKKLEYKTYAGYSDKQISIPANFKGKIVVLFKDVNYHDSTHTSGTSIDKWTNLCSAIWIPIAGLDMNGVSFVMSNFEFVTNGEEILTQAGV